jgi:hypothetical protein
MANNSEFDEKTTRVLRELDKMPRDEYGPAGWGHRYGSTVSVTVAQLIKEIRAGTSFGVRWVEECQMEDFPPEPPYSPDPLIWVPCGILLIVVGMLFSVLFIHPSPPLVP